MEMVKKVKFLFLCFSACEKKKKEAACKRRKKVPPSSKEYMERFLKAYKDVVKKGQKGDVVKK